MLHPPLTPLSPSSSVYRTIELLNGWSGPIATNQTLFCVLDALLMVSTTRGPPLVTRFFKCSSRKNSHQVITIWLYNIVHPGLCL